MMDVKSLVSFRSCRYLIEGKDVHNNGSAAFDTDSWPPHWKGSLRECVSRSPRPWYGRLIQIAYHFLSYAIGFEWWHRKVDVRGRMPIILRVPDTRVAFASATYARFVHAYILPTHSSSSSVIHHMLCCASQFA